jgi:hypothetical protein
MVAVILTIFLLACRFLLVSFIEHRLISRVSEQQSSRSQRLDTLLRLDQTANNLFSQHTEMAVVTSNAQLPINDSSISELNKAPPELIIDR